MYRFNWEQINMDALIVKCKSLTINEKGQKDAIKLHIGSILKSTGGLSIANVKWSKVHQEEVVFKLFHEALKHYLKEKYSFSNQSSGFYIDKSNRLQLIEQVDPNIASKETLVNLPVLGSALSDKIIADRRINGRYDNLDELQERIQGLGSEGADILKGIIKINSKSFGQISEDFDTNFKNAFELFCINFGRKSLVNFLTELAGFTSSNPHPASKGYIKRNELENLEVIPELKLRKVKKATLLANENYYSFIVNSINSAESSIDICMFFLSYGSNSHPNKKLLDLLVEKHKDGLKVRILLDKDRENDPYGSRIINSKAANYLKKKGVAVRFDQVDRLLHSKFVILDNKSVVVGSHNWTKGSFSEYDDISLSFESAKLTLDFTKRFSQLWTENPD